MVSTLDVVTPDKVGIGLTISRNTVFQHIGTVKVRGCARAGLESAMIAIACDMRGKAREMNEPVALGMKLDTKEQGTLVPAAVLAATLENFLDLVNALGQEMMPNIHIDWGVRELRQGSARVVLEPIDHDWQTTELARQVQRGLRVISDALDRGGPESVPYGEKVKAACRKLSSSLTDRAPYLTLIAGGHSRPVPRLTPTVEYSTDVVYTTVEGTVERLNSHDDRWFLLYEHVHGWTVQCLMAGKWADLDMTTLWERHVAVTGVLTTVRHNHAMTMREIEAIDTLPDVPADFERTAGILKLPLTGEEVLEAQRRVRHGS
jgi:hypothetical protein